MQDSTALPNLLMLPSSALVPHEDVDPRRVERLSKRILEEGLLKNPPVVAQVPDTDRYVVLDGANRTMAFKNAGVPHIVAQCVSYEDPGVQLDAWYHVVCGLEWDDFERDLEAIEGLRLQSCDQDEGRRAVIDGEAIAYSMCDSGARKLLPATAGEFSTMRFLSQIVGAYKGRADICRASNDIWEIQKPFYPDVTALVVYPPLKPEDILNAGANGEKVPSGITRHIIPARALNINIPLGILMADWPLERKRAWLDEWMMERMGANAIRFYAESTFSFNE